MKERFGDWNLYHKSVAALVSALAFGIVLRGILVIDTAFEVTDGRDINSSVTSVWTLLSQDDNRDRWQAEMIDLVELTGPTAEPGATRLIFWKRGLKRWQAVERTRDSLQGRILSFEQSSDRDTRWVTMSLTVIDACTTRLDIEEIIEPKEYLDRFWFFSARGQHQDRLDASFDALERWAKQEDTTCENT